MDRTDRADSPPAADTGAPDVSLSTLFDLLPIGAYRSAPDGRQLRANAALVRINGYDSEAELLAAVRDIASEFYVDPHRREQFRAALERDGSVRGFVSEAYRHRTRERIWISENAHLVRAADGTILFYEGTVEDITARVTAQHEVAHSEELLRQITAQLPGMVYRALAKPGSEGRYLYVSAGVRELFGIEPEQVLADPRLLRRYCHPDDLHLLAGFHQAAVDGRAPQAQALELRVVLPGGQVKWLQVNSSPVSRDDEGGVLRTGVMLDITTRKSAEAELRASEQRWMQALDSVGDGIWDWNIETGQEVFSRRFLETYGFAENEIAQNKDSFDQRTHPDDRAQMDEDRQAHFDGCTARYVNEHRVRCKDGRWKWILSRGLVIERDAQGRPLRMIGTHTDITAQKQSATLRLARDRAEAADRAKSELLSRVSHELRTPLNAVLGFAQLLDVDPALSSRQHQWVRHILDGGRHLLGLVEDVLDVSSAQSGQMRLALSDVDLQQAVAQSQAMLEATAARTGVLMALEGFGDGPLMVRADPRRLTQVVNNLLSNAIKYNRPGGRIAISAQRREGHVELRVADTGRGIEADQMARLFHPFERLGAQHGDIEGTGLGLALTRQLVEAMAGSVDATSMPGVGTTFVVQLPAAAGHNSAAG